MNTLGSVDHQVRASCVGAETPDLSGIGSVPLVFVSHNPSACFEIVTGADLAILNGGGELVRKGLGIEIQTIVFVLGLAEGSNGRYFLDGLTVADDRVGNLEGNTSMVLLEVLKREGEQINLT